MLRYHIFPAIFLFLLCRAGNAQGQRVYADKSILSTGSWYKLAVKEAGIYKIDAALLGTMGISNAPSASVRLYGNGGRMLPEDNASPRPDDLTENAIFVSDGGDGLLNGNDYILFYAPGPHTWQKTTDGYQHTYNLYTDSACYFLNISPGGLRIQTDNQPLTPNTTANSYDFHAFYEKDLYNILSSGKNWVGEEMNASVPDRNYSFTLPAALTDTYVRFRGIARSTGSSRFDVTVNGSTQTFFPSPVSGNIFEEYATIANGWFAVTNPAAIVIKYTGTGSSRGWLDFLEVQGRAPLTIPAQGALLFSDALSAGRIVNFTVTNANAQTQIWNVTDASRPRLLNTTLTGNSLQFNADCTTPQEFAAFTPAGLPAPQYIGPVANQNLHGSGAADMLIITGKGLEGEAARLAAFHSDLRVQVIPVEAIYNEFASGNADPTAIRDCIKMYHDKHGLRYVLLFGRASFDYKNRLPNNTNLVPTWESESSFHGITSYMSDDYFGFLDDGDNIGNNGQINLLDVAIGRIPVRNAGEAKMVVDKIIRYQTPQTFGAWRNEMTFVADDEDNNLHLNDAETISRIIEQEQPEYNVGKIYLDAFPQVASSGGSRYPAVNEAINNRINSGTLVWNFTGHGSSSRLAEEAVLDENSLADWKNADHLPLIVTATCDFAPFDNPAFNSLGEQLVMMPQGGAIGLMTTTRAVFAASNLVLSANYFRLAFQPGTTLGEGSMRAKNDTYAGQGDVINNRKFHLLGDPALPLAYPQLRVYTDSINGLPLTGTDTLKALGRYTIKGSVRNNSGVVQESYNGTVITTVFDKPGGRNTRGNDPGSSSIIYQQQDRVLFKGTQQVRQGRFSCTFVVPKDILQTAGNGKISYYTQNETIDGGGAYHQLTVNGTADALADNEGPEIEAWMNDLNFREGGITSEDPVLLVHLADENGINATGNGIGHDLTAILDDSSRFYNMNAYFTATQDEYKEGSIRFPLAGLSAGEHTLTIRAWDTYNNSSAIRIKFRVVPKATLAVESLYNYPNPFHNETYFVFRHNQQDVDLDVVIRIFTPAGELVRTIRSTIIPRNGRYDGVPWDGTSGSGAKLNPGIYFYQVTVTDKMSKEKVFGGKAIKL